MTGNKNETTAAPSARGTLRAYVALMRAANQITRNAHVHLSRVDLTISQFAVLEAIYHLGPRSQKELAAKVLKSSNNMTTVIDNLERRELVERRPHESDRRVKWIALTEQGHALVEELFPRHTRGLVREFNNLSSDEQSELARLCLKLTGARGEEA